jgi:hypothetical protein
MVSTYTVRARNSCCIKYNKKEQNNTLQLLAADSSHKKHSVQLADWQMLPSKNAVTLGLLQVFPSPNNNQAELVATTQFFFLYGCCSSNAKSNVVGMPLCATPAQRPSQLKGPRLPSEPGVGPLTASAAFPIASL